MGRIDELASAEFARWEERTRGWHVWPQPVRPEPPFEEFVGYRLRGPPLPDDSRRPTLFASLFDSIQRTLDPPPVVEEEEAVEPEPSAASHPLACEFTVSIPTNAKIGSEAFRCFLDATSACYEPVCFELFGARERVTIQMAASRQDANWLERQLHAFFPQVTFTPTQEHVAKPWRENVGDTFVVEFGLAHEAMLPLNTRHDLDPFLGLIAALSGLQARELAVFQVLFQPVQNAWAASLWRSVTGAEGKGLFVNRPHLVPGTKMKVETPFFGVVVRVAAKAEDFDRAAIIVRDIAFALQPYERLEGNRLIPVSNDDYPYGEHMEDLLARLSRRSGMLLNRDELLGLVHFPSDDVRSEKLERQRTRTKAAPTLSASGILLGYNRHAGRSSPVFLTVEQRVRHTHIIGASGTGKSTLLLNLIRQDVEKGEGLAVLDPHGDLIERVLGCIPAHRVDDVVFLDPTDEEFSIGFNVLAAHSEFEKNLLASDLVSVFRRLSSSWGDQLNSVLNNAILAFLESSRGGTLSDLRRFLLDSEFRKDFLESVRDPDIVYYWRKAFPQLGGNKSVGPVLTRLDTFLAPKPIRYMVSQTANRLDFANILDGGKIFLAKLSQGQIGKENAFLLGSLLMAKFQQMAMSRQRLSVGERRDFYVYLDEFQNFITPSMAEILTDARKYRIGLVLAHQELHQLQRDSEVASAVMSNPCTRVVFRVGDADAHLLERGFASFVAKDLQSLGTGEAICRIERSDHDFNLNVPLPSESDPAAAAETRNQVITFSRKKYATPRSEVEAVLFRASELKADEAPEPLAKRAKAAKEPKTEVISPPAEVPTLPTGPAEAKPAKPEPVGQTNELEAQTTTSTEPGRGGAQHKTIQHRIKAAAEALGYRATEEKSVLDGSGSVDLALESRKRTIACEITITTTIDHEFGNVTKCLKAGFSHVAVVSSRSERLIQIKQAVDGGLAADQAKRVGYYSVDEFLAYLNRLADEDAKEPTPPLPDAMNRGYKVKRSSVKLSSAEAKAREDAATKMVAEAMKRKVP